MMTIWPKEQIPQELLDEWDFDSEPLLAAMAICAERDHPRDWYKGERAHPMEKFEEVVEGLSRYMGRFVEIKLHDHTTIWLMG